MPTPIPRNQHGVTIAKLSLHGKSPLERRLRIIKRIRQENRRVERPICKRRRQLTRRVRDRRRPMQTLRLEVPEFALAAGVRGHSLAGEDLEEKVICGPLRAQPVLADDGDVAEVRVGLFAVDGVGEGA